MTTPPPLPHAKSRRRTLLFVILAGCCVALAVHTVMRNASSEDDSPSPPPEEASVHPIPLREIDVDKLVTQYSDKLDYFRKLDAATLAEYERNNPADASWFADGRQAVRLFTVVLVWGDFYGQGLLQTSDAYAAAAWKKGCRDPLIETICDVFQFQDRYSSSPQSAQAHIDHTQRLLSSGYSAVFKLSALSMLLKNLTFSQVNCPDLEETLGRFWERIPEFIPTVGEQFTALLKEEVPTDVVFSRGNFFFDRVDDSEWLVPVENEIERAFARENPTHPARAALRGDFLIQWAWQARGSGWAHTVTEEGRRFMQDRLDQANRTLTTAYEKNPSDYLAATLMLVVELGQGNGHDVMEMWFERAMKDRPDNFTACSRKAWYLQPRWYGSPQEVVEFGIECVRSENWRGKLPLILPIAIKDLADQQEDLYRNDEVWNLVAPVYEKFLEHYPDSISTRTTYADCAARGGRIDVLQKQLSELGENWDRSVWSNADYDRISRLAKQP